MNKVLYEQSGLTAGALSADLLPSTRVKNFRSFSLQITGTFVGTLTFQGSNDGSTFVSIGVVNVTGGAIATTTAAVGMFAGMLMYKYLRIRMTAYTSGSALGNLKFSDDPLNIDHLISSSSISTLTTLTGGGVAHDGADSGNPVKIGGKAFTADPTPVASADRADLYVDTLGKIVNTPIAPRALLTQNNITLTTTGETTLLAAGGASIFIDISWLIVTNTSATAVRLDIRDATAGTVRLSLQLEAGKTLPVDLSDVPMIQATANGNWTAQLSGAVTDVRITAMGAKRKA